MNEERFRASFDEAGVGIANLSMDGRWLRVNREMSNITGYQREELIRRPYDDIIHENGVAFSVGGVYKRTPAGEKFEDVLQDCQWTQFG